jgi:hypothetical protein
MANTGVGWQAASSERLVREVAGSRGAAGGQQGGDVDRPWEVLFFVSMGVESRCCLCHSAAHHRHMKRQPCLCHHHPCCGRRHCNCPCHLRCRHRLHHHCRCCCPSPLPSAIFVAVSVNHCHRHLCCIAVSHRHCRCCCPHHQPLLSPSLLAIAVAISVGHHRHRCHWQFLRVVALAQQKLYSTNRSKECSPYFF